MFNRVMPLLTSALALTGAPALRTAPIEDAPAPVGDVLRWPKPSLIKWSGKDYNNPGRHGSRPFKARAERRAKHWSKVKARRA